jgi:protease-4
MLFSRTARRAGLALALAVSLALPGWARDKDEKPAGKPAEKKDEKAAKKTITLAHIKLSGSMEEAPPHVDPLLGTVGETLRIKLERLEKAAADPQVNALYLEIDGLAAGWGKLEELSKAIAKVRSKGKKVYAYVESGATRDYLLGLACDEVCMPEPAWLMLVGTRIEATFYKGLLAKLGVQADFLHMGDFKSAAEPFTRDSLSEPNRKQLTAMLDDFYDHQIVGRIVAARPERKLSAAQVKKLIDGGPYTPKEALKAGLIDRVGYEDLFRDEIQKALQGDEVKVLRDYGKKKDDDIDIFSLYRKLIFGPGKASSSRAAKVAVIYASGAITTGKSSNNPLMGETVGSETIVKAIRQAEEDKTVKAIVLRVDSPGGSAVASDLIWKELKKSKKPVVASMSDVAASGGYYISMGAKKIYAEPGTITGSIGVVGGKMALRGLYDKLGIKTEVIARGANSGILSGTDVFSASEKGRFKALMQDVYDIFVDKALEGRKQAGKQMTRDQLLSLAGGRIWTGRQAKENGLIDELGTLDDAIAAAWKMAGEPVGKKPELLQLPKAKNILDSLLNFGGSSLSAPELRLLEKLPELHAKVRSAAALLHLRKEPVWAILPYQVEVK